jgi:hypothetical protein
MATESDNVNSGALGTLLAVGLCSVMGFAFVVTALVRAETADELEKKEVSADRPYRDLVADQGAKMSAPAAYVDRGRGLVSLPIDRAMEVVVAGLKKDPNSATPPAPIGGTGGTGGTAATAETGGGGGIDAEMGGTGGSTGGTGGTGGAASEGQTKPADEAIHAEGGKNGGTKPHASAGPVTSAREPAIPLPPPVPASPSPNGQ